MAAVKSFTSRIVKALCLFSGVQALSIVCSIVRTKLIALWIGAAGVGVFGLFSQAFETLTTLFQLGMRNAAVRDVTNAASTNKLARMALIVRRWAWVLGIIGAFITLIASPALSQVTFGDNNHTIGFIVLAAGILFSSVTNGEYAIMQGSERLSHLARASVWGSVVGLAISIPLYYYLGIDSIALSITAFTGATAVAALILRTRTRRPDPVPTLKQTVAEGQSFLRLGIYMTIAVFITLAAQYLFMAWLNHEAGTGFVGCYQAGYTITNRYLGLIFAAIGFELYPRLTKVANSKLRTSTFVSHEALLLLAIIFPAATTLMAIDDLIVQLLYSSDFLETTTYVNWSLAGTGLRAVSWCMAFTILARGEGRIYLITEAVSSIAFIILSFIGYKYLSLEGLGMAYTAWYLIYTIIVGIPYFYRYGLKLSPTPTLFLLVTTLITAGCAIVRTAEQRLPVIIVAAFSILLGIFILRKLSHKSHSTK